MKTQTANDKGSTLVKITTFAAVAGLLAAIAMPNCAPAGPASPMIAADMSGFSQPGFVLKRISPSAVHHQKAAPRVRLWDTTNENWSGYAVPMEQSDVNDIFSEVEGAWTVPAVKGGKSAAHSSAWVGLDGYEDQTVEQIGTEQDWTGKRQENYAWFEMYPDYAYEIEAPVVAGDTILARVTFLEEHTVRLSSGGSEESYVFQLVIWNLTRRWAEVVPTSYTTVSAAARGSAEWVMEAPWSNDVLPLADFGTVNFWDCTATSERSDGKVEPISFWPKDPLTMIDPNGGQAVPSASVVAPGGSRFSVSWSQ